MWVWFLIGIVFVIIEGISFGLISIWFAIGAFVTMFFTNLSLNIQLYIFILTSGISLLLIRRFALIYLKGKGKELDRVIFIIISLNSSYFAFVTIYLVKLDGKIWEAICDERLELEEIAQVEKIKGNKLILNKIK